jgi:cysteine-rich repeat protein
MHNRRLVNSREKGTGDMVKNLSTGALVLASAILVAGGVSTANALATKESLKCADSKLKALSKDYGSKFKCYSKAVQKGLVVEPLCLSKAEAKTTESFEKAIAKGGCATDADFFDQNEECPSVPAVPPIGDTIPDGQIGSILHVINCGYPTVPGLDDIISGAIPTPLTTSKCTAKKVGELGKFAAALYQCEAKGASKNIPTDQACTDKAIKVFNDKVAKEEAKTPNDCQTTGDAPDLSSEVFRTFGRVTPLVPRFDGCGNGLVTTSAPFSVESCDDGNTENFDSCPSDCTIDACTPTANPQPVTVVINDPTVAGIAINLDYPEGKVTLPGLGFEADVTNLTAGLLDPLDYEHAIRIGLSDAGSFGQTQLVTLNFDDCQGAVPPVVDDFQCNVIEAFGPGGMPPLPNTTCTVTIP